MKKSKKKRSTESVDAMKMDVSNIHLDGEEREDVPVYDTCDEVRKKIRAFLCQDGVSQAAFLREVAKAFGNGRKIQANMLNQFLSKEGPNSGNLSSVFYASYVFFEKTRIREGKPKTTFREKMENIWDGVSDWGYHNRALTERRGITLDISVGLAMYLLLINMVALLLNVCIDQKL